MWNFPIILRSRKEADAPVWLVLIMDGRYKTQMEFLY